MIPGRWLGFVERNRRSQRVIGYDLFVTTMTDHIASRDRLHKAYASQHLGRDGSVTAALTYRRNIRPALPRPSAGLVIDIGCGRGELVRRLLADSYDAGGIDGNPEQVVRAHAAGLWQVRRVVVHRAVLRRSPRRRASACRPGRRGTPARVVPGSSPSRS